APVLALRDLVRVGPRGVEHHVLLLALIEGDEGAIAFGSALDHAGGQLVATFERLDLDVEDDRISFGEVVRGLIRQNEASVLQEAPVTVQDFATRGKLHLDTAHRRQPPKKAALVSNVAGRATTRLAAVVTIPTNCVCAISAHTYAQYVLGNSGNQT